MVAGGVAVVDKWAPLERPDKIATAEVDKVKDKSIKRGSRVAQLLGECALSNPSFPCY